MKNQKGITMTSLTIFIISFVIIIGIIGSITVFFTNNTKEISMSSGASSEYNKFNLYMLEHTKNGYEIYECSNIEQNNENDGQYVTFSKDAETNQEINTFVKLGRVLYFNNVKLCENVDSFKVQKDISENGKDILKTYLQINGTVYTTDYVVE